MNQDLRLALRSLFHRPGLTLTTIAVLALGIGSTTALLSVVWQRVLGPPPFSAPDRLLLLRERDPSGDLMGVDLPTVADWREASATLASQGVFGRGSSLVERGGEARRIASAVANAGFFDTLGIRPSRGRLFSAAEDAVGGQRAVVLSDGAWERLTGRDPAIVGSTLLLDGKPHEVVGVLPSAFAFGAPVDVWQSLGSFLQSFPPELRESRSEHYFVVVARMRDGVKPAAVKAELEAIAARLARQHPDTEAGVTADAVPLHESLVADSRAGLFMLLAAVVLLLAVCCLDLGVLWLMRARGRQRELSVRRALGAPSGRLVKLLMTESALVCLLGGAAAAAVASWSLRLLERWLPPGLGGGDGLTLAPQALVAGLAVALVAAATFAALPFLGSRQQDDAAALRSARGGTRRSRATDALVIAEVAGSTALVLLCVLLLASVSRLVGVDPGFEPTRVVATTVSLTGPDDAATLASAWDRVLATTAALPAVVAVGASPSVPLGAQSSMGVEVEGGGDAPVLARHAAVAGELFAALGVPLRAGRTFGSVDQRPDAIPVAIVNETFARRHWGSAGAAIGKRLRWAVPGLPEFPWRTVVGVVGDTRDYGLAEAVEPAMSYPFRQLPDEFFAPVCREMTLLARTDGDPAALTAGLRDALRRTTPGAVIGESAPMTAAVERALDRPRLYARLTGAFAAVALLLAALAIHGVLASQVLERQKELGIRLAVGARPEEIRRMVLRRGARLSAWGLLLGLAGGVAGARALRGVLHEVSGLEPTWLGVVAATVLVVSVGASLLPARRALHIDPVVALQRDQ